MAPANVNNPIQQVLQLPRARRSDTPRRRGVMVEVRTDLAAELPVVMAAERRNS